MSQSYQKLSGRQLAAARTLLGMTQPELAGRASISVPTLKRMEASEGAVSGMANNVGAVRAALEAAGVIFVEENGEGPGVRLKRLPPPPHSDAALDHQIAAQETVIEAIPDHIEPSPEAGMAAMDKAMAKNDLIEMKNEKTRRRATKQKLGK